MFRVLGNCIQDGIVTKLAMTYIVAEIPLMSYLVIGKEYWVHYKIQFKVVPLKNSNLS